MPPKTLPATDWHAPPQPSRLQTLLRTLDRELSPELQETIQRANLLRNNSASMAFVRHSPEPAAKHPTGLHGIDELIGGGFPVGSLSEISGSISSGRTTLVLALLARATRNGAHVAWVEGAEAFDPLSAEAAGVALERVLWVRAPHPLAALRCSERILETEGFALVVLDLTRRFRTRNSNLAISQTVWLRLTRLTAGKQNTLILLSDERLAGSRAALALEMQPAIAHFTGTPALLESLELRALLTRRRPNPRETNIQQNSKKKPIKHPGVHPHAHCLPSHSRPSPAR